MTPITTNRRLLKKSINQIRIIRKNKDSQTRVIRKKTHLSLTNLSSEVKRATKTLTLMKVSIVNEVMFLGLNKVKEVRMLL